jgi:hypothetical protein
VTTAQAPFMLKVPYAQAHAPPDKVNVDLHWVHVVADVHVLQLSEQAEQSPVDVKN